MEEVNLKIFKIGKTKMTFNVNDKRMVRQRKEINQLYPLKYAWAYDFYKKTVANLWFPEEINMVKDVSDYKNLTPPQRHVFTNVLAYLTTADIGALRNVSTALMGKLTSPEIQMFLGGQTFNECVHSESYAHAIETIGLDQDYIYNRYAEVPAIGAKISMLTDRTKLICSKDDTLEDGQDLFDFIHEYFFFSAIFEGSSFMSSFNPIFSLKYTANLMGGTFEQLRFIRREEINHVTFGLRAIKQICSEENIQLNDRVCNDLFMESYDKEVDYINYILREPLMGYSIDDHLSQFRHYCNLRANFMGLSKPFKDTRELSWLGEIIDSNKEQNFFEGTVSEYQVGAKLDYGQTSTMDQVSNWNKGESGGKNFVSIEPGAVCDMSEGCESCQ